MCMFKIRLFCLWKCSEEKRETIYNRGRYSVPAEAAAILQVQEVTNISRDLLSSTACILDIRIPLKICLF